MSGRPGLRILLVPSAYYPHTGGIEETTRRLALELQGRGHQAMVLTNRWPPATAAREIRDGVRVRRLRFELPGRRPRALARFAAVAPLAAAGLLGTVRAFRPQVVHVHGAGPPAAYVAALRGIVRAPIVFTAHGEFRNDAHAAFLHSLPLRWALGSLLRHSAAVTAPSRAVLDELAAAFAPAGGGEVLPNAIDPAEFAVPPHPDDVARPYILAAGRLVPQKGFDILLRAFDRSRSALGGRRLVVAGEGPERPALTRLVSDLRLDGHVDLIGAVRRARLAELMRGADLFAFPSRQEAFGIALLEAMAAGTPAVATSVGGIPEFAHDGQNALLVPPDDVGLLAAALIRLGADAELRDRLAAGGRAQAAMLTWARLAPRYERLYEGALARA